MNQTFRLIPFRPFHFHQLQALAHEIAVDKDFQIQKADFPPTSFEGTFKSILHKAFWDLMEEKLKEDPLDYESAISVFEDVKKLMDAVLLPQVSLLID